jgi:hypothetical protein
VPSPRPQRVAHTRKGEDGQDSRIHHGHKRHGDEVVVGAAHYFGDRFQLEDALTATETGDTSKVPRSTWRNGYLIGDSSEEMPFESQRSRGIWRTDSSSRLFITRDFWLMPEVARSFLCGGISKDASP